MSIDYASKDDLIKLNLDLRHEMAALRVDVRKDMQIMRDDVLGVLGDMMQQIDKRFNRLESAFARWQEDDNGFENSGH